ncbi:MAG: hypothetical protein ACREBD_36415 [Blastocatellia bacterium]
MKRIGFMLIAIFFCFVSVIRVSAYQRMLQRPQRQTTTAQKNAKQAKEDAARQNKREPWQTDWKAYVAKLGNDLRKGIHPREDVRIKGKIVEFEGTLLEVFNPAKPDYGLDIEMEPQQITVMLRLFPGVDVQKAGNKTGTITIRKVSVKPAETNRDVWNALEKGSKVRFRATVGEDAAVLFLASGPGEDPSGRVMLFLRSAEVVPPK